MTLKSKTIVALLLLTFVKDAFSVCGSGGSFYPLRSEILKDKGILYVGAGSFNGVTEDNLRSYKYFLVSDKQKIELRIDEIRSPRVWYSSVKLTKIDAKPLMDDVYQLAIFRSNGKKHEYKVKGGQIKVVSSEPVSEPLKILGFKLAKEGEEKHVAITLNKQKALVKVAVIGPDGNKTLFYKNLLNNILPVGKFYCSGNYTFGEGSFRVVVQEVSLEDRELGSTSEIIVSFKK